MARPPAGRPNADEPVQPHGEAFDESLDTTGVDDGDDALLDEDEGAEDEALAADEAAGDGAESRRTATVDRFWTRVRVDPVEIALPGGAGYTLRAYRQSTDITPADVSEREDDVPMPQRHGRIDPDEDSRFVEDDLDEVEDDLVEVEDDADETDDFVEDANDGETLEETPEEDAAAADTGEEVPLFLSRGGHLLVFQSAESLVDFVLSDAEHDLQQLDTWDAVTRGIQPEYVVAEPDDTYELDLVVKNLRGGHDAWDPELLVRSGQLARDIAHALSVEPVVLALSPGSPLDDLDEALRAVADGGVGSFFARRRLKKIGAETASIGWRTVVGKIAAVVDWRD